MNYKLIKISALLCALSSSLFLAAVAESRSSLNGSAEVSYTNYTAEAEGKELFSGDSLAQKYSLSWSATNLVHRNQPRYYSLGVGYDWTSFSTKITDVGVDSELKDNFGKFRYNGTIGYAPTDLPIRFRAYLNDDSAPRFQYNIYDGLMDDGLVYDLEGRSKGMSSGFTFVFEPEQSRAANMRGLPRLHVDYKELRNKNLDRFAKVDNLTRELAVAGLNKENNWLHYRSIKYENYRDTNSNFDQQQIQLGLIDYAGRRKWSPLTNWILVSADGQLTNRKGANESIDMDEYDINFQAMTYRKTWEAKTFMNYNRLMVPDRLTEQVKVPIYVKGIWGADTDWYLQVSANRGREKGTIAQLEENSYNNIISVGATTFRRANFTLSPKLKLRTDKTFGGKDTYEIMAGVETESTRRYSDKLFLMAGYLFKLKDDGYGTDGSKTWSQNVNIRANYRPNKSMVYEVRQDVEVGNGTAYIDAVRAQLLTGTSDGYMRSVTTAAAGYTGSADFNANLEATYDLIKSDGLPDNQLYLLSNRINYTKSSIWYRLDTRYERRDNGVDKVRTLLTSDGDVQYRPDRYHEGLVRFRLSDQEDINISSTNLELLQRYSYNFFTKTGVIRNLGKITQEFSYEKQRYNGIDSDTKYLLLAGRYSPTSRLSLYGSVKYQSDPGAISMYYNAGLAADFKLLTTSLDYSLAKRDSDNRTEKKLTAVMRRSF